MIIVDDTPASPSKAPQDLLQAQPPADVAPPPAYPGHSTYQPDLEAGSSRPHPRDAQRSPLIERVDSYFQGRISEPARRRFVLAFTYAALIWFLLIVLTRSIIVGLTWSAHHGGRVSIYQNSRMFSIERADLQRLTFKFPDWDQRPDPDEGLIARPHPGDGAIKRCVTGASQWYQGPYHEVPRTAFEVPISANVINMFSRGSLATGAITFKSHGAESGWSQDKIGVEVLAGAGNHNALDLTSVCLLERSPGEYRIGFLVSCYVFYDRYCTMTEGLFAKKTPEKRLSSKIDFEIIVSFPEARSSSSSLLRIKTFESDLAQFGHSIGNLSHVYFDSFRVDSRRNTIEAEVCSVSYT